MFLSELPQFLKNTTRTLLLIEEIDSMCLHFSSLYLFYGHFSSAFRRFLLKFCIIHCSPSGMLILSMKKRKSKGKKKKKKKSNNISLTPVSVVPISYMNFPSAFAKEQVNSCILQEDNLMQPTETVKHLVISCHYLHQCCRYQITQALPTDFEQTLLKKNAAILHSLSEISLPTDLSVLDLYFT